jgi:L-2-hydroxyglutarate oxidase LhgO
MEKVDIAIIGAGVIGLAIARELSKSHQNVVVLENNPKFGQETSSRNSEVIHSGIYYPSQMLKTRLCIEGNQLLYEFCKEHRITHYRIGKLIIANDESEMERLESLLKRAREHNLEIQEMGKRQVGQMEPDVLAEYALFLPNTGIIHSYGYLQSLYYLAREQGVIFLFNTALQGLEYNGKDYILHTPVERIKADRLVNAAGLHAEAIPRWLGMDLDKSGYRLHPCKGEYFKINKKLKINHLIYPLPGQYGLGIHLTKDTYGNFRLGPNTHYVEEIDYSVNEEHQKEFFQAARRYLPFLEFDHLSPDFAGIRPKLQAPHEQETRDFVISEETGKGFPGLLNLLGIESPGLTASLAIARLAAKLLQ